MQRLQIPLNKTTILKLLWIWMHFRPSEAAAAVRDRLLRQPQRRPRLRLRRQRGRLLPGRRQQLRHLRIEAEQEERLQHA